jgi:hypothetical protein
MLLGVTDQQVSHLCWLDAPEPPRAQPLPEPKDDELPDDYPGSALRASARVSGIPGPAEPHWAMSEGSLLRFQEVLRDAALDSSGESTSAGALTDAATILAEQTRDILSSVPPAPTAKRASSSGSRKRQRRKSLTPVTPAAAADEPSLEGQVAGLKALRKP